MIRLNRIKDQPYPNFLPWNPDRPTGVLICGKISPSGLRFSGPLPVDKKGAMRDASKVVDETFLEMRWRCLSLAADLDRIQRARDGGKVLASDARLTKLRQALQALASPEPDRAERVQMIFSDTTPPPPR
jgi:hypothetical protein